jgi:cytochrome c
MRGWLTSYMLAAGVALAAAQGGAARSVWEGVYTEAQAARGEAVSEEQCARCHGPTLAGAEAAPALVGDVFNSSWDGVPLGELAQRIRDSMPLDAPGSLSRRQTTDIMAYMLKRGRVPAGATELPTDTGALDQITFVGSRPQ